MDLVLLILALLACGVFAGILAGLLGVGGGIVIVPMLYHVFTVYGVEPNVAMSLSVGTSLSTIVLTAWVSARNHHRRGIGWCRRGYIDRTFHLWCIIEDFVRCVIGPGLRTHADQRTSRIEFFFRATLA